MNRNRNQSSELLSIISHEIKNSLNPVISLSGLLLKDHEGKFDTDEREYLEIIERNGRKILSLVEQFSYINKLKNRSYDVHPVSVKVRTVIENSLILRMNEKNRPHVETVFDIEEGPADPLLCSEIFGRIIDNVIEFFMSQLKVGRLFFSSFTKNEYIYLNIANREISGRIIPVPGQSSSVSEVDRVSLSSLLWLTLATEIVSVSGGVSSLDYLEKDGIVYSFSLPLPSEAGSHSVDMTDAANDTGREFVMMVIDDDPDNLVPVRAIAEHEFKGLCTVVYAQSGREGLDLLDKVKPDIILLDLTLPDISGFTLIKSIRNFFIKAEVPVIAFTGLDVSQNNEKIFKSGFDDVIKKPFDVDMFVLKIRKWIK